MDSFRQTFRIQLTAQEAARVQVSLFDLAPAAPKCEHTAIQYQRRLDGAIDKVCILCWNVVHP